MTSLVRDENRIAALGGESTVSRVILPAKINATSNRLLTETNVLNSSGTVIDPATSDNQTNGTQKTQITTALINFVFDSVYLTEPDTVTEVYTYKLSGDTVATITIIYTDATKETLVSCIRS